MKQRLILPELNVISNDKSAAMFTIGNGMRGDGDKPMSTGDAAAFHYISKLVAKNYKLVVATEPTSASIVRKTSRWKDQRAGSTMAMVRCHVFSTNK